MLWMRLRREVRLVRLLLGKSCLGNRETLRWGRHNNIVSHFCVSDMDARDCVMSTLLTYCRIPFGFCLSNLSTLSLFLSLTIRAARHALLQHGPQLQ